MFSGVNDWKGWAVENQIMDLDQLAAYLHRDVRDVSKLANRGYLPGKKVGGTWRFSAAEINHWIETQMHAFTEEELTRLERPRTATCVAGDTLVMGMLNESTCAVPLHASTKASVRRELVSLAEQSTTPSNAARRWGARHWRRAWRSRTRTARCPSGRRMNQSSPSLAPAGASRSAPPTAG